MGVPMPPVVVLIVCKSMIVGPGIPETGWENRAWVIEDGKMQCRREEVQLYSPEEAQSFSANDCGRAAIMAIPQWDEQHKGSNYRAWRVACPVPVMNTGKDGIKGTPDDEVVDWVLPDCGHPETVVCEKDIAI
jgi:predicted RNA-binding Zn-ribbon protein involved in translation (DUF1610 family)